MKPTVTIIAFISAWLCIQLPLAAETIYTWVDKDGTKRFSSEPPPDEIEHYRQFKASPQSPPNQNNTQERRQSYKKMVEQTRRESKRNRQTKLAEEAQKNRAANQELQVKIKAERDRLELQLAEAKKMALGSASRRRKRRVKIDRIQKQLHQLNTSPQAYFNERP